MVRRTPVLRPTALWQSLSTRLAIPRELECHVSRPRRIVFAQCTVENDPMSEPSAYHGFGQPEDLMEPVWGKDRLRERHRQRHCPFLGGSSTIDRGAPS